MKESNEDVEFRVEAKAIAAQVEKQKHEKLLLIALIVGCVTAVSIAATEE